MNLRAICRMGWYPYVSTAKYVGELALMRAARASLQDQCISSYGPRAGEAGQAWQGRHVGNMQEGPWSARGARASLPLDYTQWEFTIAVGRASEAGGQDESSALGYVGNRRPGSREPPASLSRRSGPTDTQACPRRCGSPERHSGAISR